MDVCSYVVYNVHVTDVVREDSGNYTCEVRGEHSVVLSHVLHRLFVRGRQLFFLHKHCICIIAMHCDQARQSFHEELPPPPLRHEIPLPDSLMRYIRLILFNIHLCRLKRTNRN